MLGFSLEGANGIGDKLIFSSFPENYFKNTNEKVIDLDSCWIFDHNPYVIRNEIPDKTINLFSELWSTPTLDEFIQKPIFNSVAERTMSIFKMKVYLRHPRLYIYENEDMLKRVVIHTSGKTRGILNDSVLEHIVKKYKDYKLIQVGAKEDKDINCESIKDSRGCDIWDVVKIIAQSGIFIGVDSGPSWIAACYPQIFNKKVLCWDKDYLENKLVPGHKMNNDFHWYNYGFTYYNQTLQDIGISYSYLKI